MLRAPYSSSTIERATGKIISQRTIGQTNCIILNKEEGERRGKRGEEKGRGVSPEFHAPYRIVVSLETHHSSVSL